MTDKAASIPPSHKRQPDPSTAEDPAKKSKANITDEMRQYALDHLDESVIASIPDELLASVHLTREDMKLSQEERNKLCIQRFEEERAANQGDEFDIDFDEPEYGPEDALPKGYDWASYCPGSGHKDFIVKMHCCVCGLGMDHWAENCPNRATVEPRGNIN